jgi:hypothetical protein
MTRSGKLAGLVGPALLAIAASEALNMPIYAAQIAPVVYLNGTLLFIAGLALVRAHNLWRLDWTVLLTLTGWVSLLVGLYRMFLPALPQAAAGVGTYLILAILFAIGAMLTVQSCLRRR